MAAPDRDWTVYRITNVINNKSYIGITCQSLRTRWNAHRSCARRGEKWALPRALRKYGEQNFSISILYIACSVREAHAVERGLIAAHRTLHPYGYNLSLGGDGHPLLPETRARLSKALRGKLLGYKHTKEALARMSENRRGKGVGQKRSDSTKSKLSEKARNRSVEHQAKLTAARRGIKLSEQWRHNLRLAHLGQKFTEIDIAKRILPVLERAQKKIDKGNAVGIRKQSERCWRAFLGKDQHAYFPTLAEARACYAENLARRIEMCRAIISGHIT